MEGLPSEPVEEGGSGEGRPYAPEDWPRAGDRWRWRAGRRTTGEGFFRDRVLLPPRRYRGSSALGRKGVLKSRLQVEQFVKLEMPEADLQEFWRLFIWRIPAASGQVRKQGSEKKTSLSACAKPSQANGHIGPVTSFCGNCKVGNKMCHIRVQALKDPFPCMPCDICCTEAGFCRDCCCILCDHTIDSGDGGYNFLRCKAVVENEDEKFICGHNAHVRCALRAYLAGTVGGNVALDAEYYCRRCDSRTDLVSYLTEVLNSSKSIDCKDDIEKILNLASCLLRGAQRINAKELHIRVEKMLAKLRDGFNLKEIWNTEDGIQALAAGIVDEVPENQAEEQGSKKSSESSSEEDVSSTRQEPRLVPTEAGQVQLTVEAVVVKTTPSVKPQLEQAPPAVQQLAPAVQSVQQPQQSKKKRKASSSSDAEEESDESTSSEDTKLTKSTVKRVKRFSSTLEATIQKHFKKLSEENSILHSKVLAKLHAYHKVSSHDYVALYARVEHNEKLLSKIKKRQSSDREHFEAKFDRLHKDISKSLKTCFEELIQENQRQMKHFFESIQQQLHVNQTQSEHVSIAVLSE